MKRSNHTEPASEARLKRLAAHIDSLADKDAKALEQARRIEGMRKAAAVELHRVCEDFVDSVNGLLSRLRLILDPAEYSEDSFRDEATNLIQINVEGRILQLEFEATPELISTEDFRIPYTLEGVVRAFNQELLDKDLIEEQLIFYTVDKHETMWRFFDARTYRSGPFNREYLVSVMEQLL